MIIPFYNPENKLLVRSKGCYQYDSDGDMYIDLESGVWCANLGHSHERVVKVMERHLEKSVHHGYLFQNREAEKLSQKFQNLLGFERGGSVFLSSGSEAVNLAITLAQKITGRKKILKVDHSYLSAFGPGYMAAGDDWQVKVKINDYEGFSDIPFSEISAFVVETGGASAGVVRFPDQAFLEELAGKACERGCLIIADEVTTGMGRTGKWFGFQHYDIVPQMVVTGKALGNGYPISGITIDARVMKNFNTRSFPYMQSHQNDPLGCATGLAVIGVLESESLIEKSHYLGNYFKERLEQIGESFTVLVKEIRGRGLMLALEFEEEVDGAKIHEQLFQKGFITGFNKNTLRFMPPQVIKKEMIDLFSAHLDELLDREVRSVGY